MSNPFDYEDSSYLVLKNEEGQYSLWPAPIEVPKGWTQMLGRPSAVYVWITLRSNGLI